MAAKTDIALVAHLMRRAGFGASSAELEVIAEKDYEAIVEELLDSDDIEYVDRFELLRYHPWSWKPGTIQGTGHATWLHDMVNTEAPLREKMAVFWHGIFATGVSKVDHWDEIVDMVDTFREKGLGNYKDILMEVAQSPAMLYWLDNNENHAEAPNENWGRELLELFSMGVGNYTETDVFECSRAFTGWTIAPKLPRFPMGRFDWEFEYREDDHDEGKKNFLGYEGNFDGEDIIDIICSQPATSRFIARHLYSFFVADEAQVPAWNTVPARDPQAIQILADAFIDSGYDMRQVLRTLFNSDFFKEARFSRIKSPVEVVVGTLRFVGGHNAPYPGMGNLARQMGYMGQEILNPPSVEGWHTGSEWINSGSLMRRINFVADRVGDINLPGVKVIIEHIKSEGEITSEKFVDLCLAEMGPLDIDEQARQELIDHVTPDGNLVWDGDSSDFSKQRISEMLQLIASLRDYQYA